MLINVQLSLCVRHVILPYNNKIMEDEVKEFLLIYT